MAFHYRGGVYFERLLDGAVKLSKIPAEGTPVWELTIDPDAWPSIVVAVSKHGETAQNFQIAKQLHMGADT